MLRGLHRFEGRSSLKTWIFTVLVNQARSRGRPLRFSSLPEEHVTGAETRRIIDEEIGNLPEGQQQVVTLRDVEGWSAEEVCEALGVSEGNQRVLLHRGRARLRSRLEAHLSLREAP